MIDDKWCYTRLGAGLAARGGEPSLRCPERAFEGRRASQFGTKKGTEFIRSEEHTSELQSLMRISYAVFCLKKKRTNNNQNHYSTHLKYVQTSITHKHY